jgi:hypothetical protein
MRGDTLEPIKPDSFYDILFTFVRGSEGFEPRVADDKKGVPTIGFGTALVTKIKGEWNVLDRLDERLEKAGVQLDSSRYELDKSKLKDIAVALDQQKVEEAQKLIREHNFSIEVNREQARKFYDIGMERDHVSIVKNKLDRSDRRIKKKARTYEQLAGTRELIALADISYSGPIRLTDELIGYVVAGERQKAFYHMAYKMRSGENLDKYKGYVTRSYNEAYMYGYAAGNKPSEAEIRALEEVYANNKQGIDDYDKKWGEKLKKEVKGWMPFAELIRLAKQGKVVAWAPPNPHNKGANRPGVSAEQIAMMTEFYIPGARPQQPGISAYEIAMLRYSGGGSDAPLNTVCDPYQMIKRRFGGN